MEPTTVHHAFDTVACQTAWEAEYGTVASHLTDADDTVRVWLDRCVECPQCETPLPYREPVGFITAQRGFPRTVLSAKARVVGETTRCGQPVEIVAVPVEEVMWHLERFSTMTLTMAGWERFATVDELLAHCATTH